MTKTVTVYRMERARDGMGPFDYQFWDDSGLVPSGQAYHMFPTPWRDGCGHEGLDADGEWRCATPDLRSMRMWFNKRERDILAPQGFVVNAYDVPANADHFLAGRSGVQVSFDKSAATRVATLDPVGFAPISAA